MCHVLCADLPAAIGEAIEKANSTTYGLGGSVFTQYSLRTYNKPPHNTHAPHTRTPPRTRTQGHQEVPPDLERPPGRHRLGQLYVTPQRRSRARLHTYKKKKKNAQQTGYNVLDAALPFGGWKESGIGRELGEEGLHNYLEHKSVCVALEE